MKPLVAACLLAVTLSACEARAPAVQASSDTRPIAEILATSGLASADAALAARSQSPETAFQLGGVRFLRAFEVMLQTRYASYHGDVPFLPGMRTPLPANPKAQFDPAFLETALTGALEHLAAAEDALVPAVQGEFATSLPLGAIWLDIDKNGQRADWESLQALLSEMGAAADWGQFDGTIRFDTADAEWLLAYVHLLAGMSELTLSLDPTPAIRTVYEGRTRLERAGAIGAATPLFADDDWIDQAAAVLLTFEGKPDAARTRKALAHFQGMIAHNRKFWPEMMAETDNDHEWLPNPSQTSPFGVTITSELATGWQDVLTEIDDMLAGRKLVPYWRTPGGGAGDRGVGINMRKLMTDPGDMNLVLLIQGAAVAPYLETGSLATMDAWNRFAAMTQSDGLLIALILN
jgi:hypothetical protein